MSAGLAPYTVTCRKCHQILRYSDLATVVCLCGYLRKLRESRMPPYILIRVADRIRVRISRWLRNHFI